MMETLNLNPNNAWTKKSRLQKRLHGFCCYLVCAFYSLVYPEAIDFVVYRLLKDQFIENEKIKNLWRSPQR